MRSAVDPLSSLTTFGILIALVMVGPKSEIHVWLTIVTEVIMDRKHRNASILMIMMAAVIMLIIGCSTDNTPLGPAATVSVNKMVTPGSFQYPPLASDLAGMPHGFTALPVAASQLDDHWCDSISASRMCDDSRTTTVQLSWMVSVRVSRGDLSSDTTIRIVAPEACIAAADFYPHPYHFNGTVEITWNIHAFNLPRNYDYSQIVPWYVTEDGQYVPLQYAWLNGHEFLQVYTNHFSRYILGGPEG